MKEPRTAIYTRFHYEDEIPKTTLYCFERYYLPSIKAQTDKNFEVIIFSNDNKKNNEIIQSIITKSGIKNITIIDKNHRELYRHEIELNLDNDDAATKYYIEEAIKQYYQHSGDIFLVVFYYFKYDIMRSAYHRAFIPTKENRGFPTPFYALIQRNEKPYHWSIRKHNELDEVIKDVVIINDESKYCVMNIRGENTLNQIYNGEERL
jgi:hypothetical protein